MHTPTLSFSRATAQRGALWAALVAMGSMGCAAPSPMPGADASDAADVTASDADASETAVIDGARCTVGATCGNDCLPSDAPCWACGTLRYNADCQCVASDNLCAPATGCDNPNPAGAGEFCGSYSWCNRPCAAGLECTGQLAGNDAGRDYRRVCVSSGDGGADATADGG